MDLDHVIIDIEEADNIENEAATIEDDAVNNEDDAPIEFEQATADVKEVIKRNFSCFKRRHKKNM